MKPKKNNRKKIKLSGSVALAFILVFSLLIYTRAQYRGGLENKVQAVTEGGEEDLKKIKVNQKERETSLARLKSELTL